MKKYIILFLILFSSIKARQTYNLFYELFDEKDKIGELHAKCVKNKDNTYIYTNNLNLKVSFLFQKYNYIYEDKIIIKNDKIVKLSAYEIDDGKTTKANPKINNNFLIYKNNNKINLSMIDYFNFDFKHTFYNKNLNKQSFLAYTFDPLTGKLLKETTKILKIKSNYIQVEVQNSEEQEIKTIDSTGLTLNIKNDLFKVILKKRN